jgi:uncharacterized protein YlxW (UPF0749 family)
MSNSSIDNQPALDAENAAKSLQSVRVGAGIAAFLLGGLIALSVKADKPWRVSEPSSNVSVIAEQLRQANDQIGGLKARITVLQDENSRLMNKGNSSDKEILSELTQAELLAGTCAVHGSGVQVTLQNSKVPLQNPSSPSSDVSVISDSDLRSVVAELLCAGAEAVSINGERVVATTAIRQVGAQIQVNFVSMQSPFIVRAIGPSDNLDGGLKFLVDLYAKVDPAMISIVKQENVQIPAYAGQKIKYLQPVRQTASINGL